MKKRILLTGVTGVLGKALLDSVRGEDVTALVRNPAAKLSGVRIIQADLQALPQLERDWNLIIHAAADTRFTHPKDELWKSNVSSTRNLITFARSCPDLRRFLYISTTCVSGNRSGLISEDLLGTAPQFCNFYEESKWQAEVLFSKADLPFQILRIPIVIGNRAKGEIRRPLAIHHALRWIAQGLVPFLPSHPEARLDIISSDYVTDVIRQTLATTAPGSNRVIHICRGTQAPAIGDVLDRLVAWLRKHRVEWAKGTFSPPALITLSAFTDFRRLIEETGDPIFRSIYQVTDVLTSTLTVPKCFATSVASEVSDTAWETLCDRVFEFHLGSAETSTADGRRLHETRRRHLQWVPPPASLPPFSVAKGMADKSPLVP